jgi:hypothetical protein
MTRLARRRSALALLAAFLSAAAPVLAHAHLALGAQQGYLEVCTDRGIARVPAGDGHHGDGGLAAAFAHCALCVSAGGDDALAADAPETFLVDRDAAPIGAAADRGVSADPLRTPQPRGPPGHPIAIA